MVTIEILITGLIAFVPQGPGQVDVLLPNTAVWNRDHPSYSVPEHRAFLGVLEGQLADGTSCAGLSGLGSVTAAGQAQGRTVCWIPLDDRELRLGTREETDAPTCRVGPPLCPQALFRAPTSP